MIYLCIPVRNEERTIGVLLWKIRRVMREFGRDYEVLVLNDGSTDNTAEVIEQYRRVLPLEVSRNETAVGHGAAVEWLMRQAVERAPYPKRDIVVTLQGDFSEGPDDVISMVKAIEGGADLVTAARGSDSRGPRPARVARWAAPILLGRAFRDAPVSDPLSGLRAYRVVVLRKAFREHGERPLVRTNGWAANLEVLRAVAPFARRITEVPAVVRNDLRQRPSRMKTVRTLRELISVRGGAWVVASEERTA